MTDLVHSRLRVADPEIAFIEGTVVHGHLPGRTEVQVTKSYAHLENWSLEVAIKMIPVSSGAVSPGIVSWTCEPVLALGLRFDSHSRRSFCCNLLYIFSDGS